MHVLGNYQNSTNEIDGHAFKLLYLEMRIFICELNSVNEGDVWHRRIYQDLLFYLKITKPHSKHSGGQREREGVREEK